MLLTILVFILILSVLVLVHELGHFFVAKKLGIKVEEFGFGLPPRAFGIKKGETIYSLNWLPIGGFVKLYGEDEAGGGRIIAQSRNRESRKAGDLDRAFFARPVWQRSLVTVAGVVMNFILSVVIISYLFGVSGVTIPGDKVIITDVVKGTPAQQAGLMKGDVIESVDGIKITKTQEVIDITKSHLGEEVELKIKNQESGIRNIKVTPRKIYPKNEGPMGVAITQNVVTKKYPLYQAPIIGLQEALKYSWLLIAGFGMAIFELFAHGAIPKGVAGPVGIAQLTGQFVAIGPLAVLSFMSLLSLNLAILNVLPIPALDGGRLFFILIEGFIGKKISQKFESKTHAIGMAILLSLIALITIHDILRFISGQPIIPKP